MEHTCIFCGNKFVVPFLDENNLSVSDVNGSTTTCGECGGEMVAQDGQWMDFQAVLNASFEEYYNKK